MKVDLTALADSVLQAVKAYCAAEFGRLFGKAIEPVLARVEAIQPAKDGGPGARGDDGKDADPEQVKALVAALVEAAIKALPPAERGERGERGEDGISIVGTKGEDGRDGRDGTRGLAGRDALQIEIRKGIDETRTYSAGTYATHKGGVWRKTDDSEGMDGWECIMCGIAEQSIEVAADDRTAIFRSVTSTGAVIEKSHRMPAMIYRGVFREGAHQKGDTVTWAGSLWHCNEDTTEKPGDGKAWQLAVKRGAEGKEGPQGKQGDPAKLVRA